MKISDSDLEPSTQRKFFTQMCHAHLNAHKLQKYRKYERGYLESIKDSELGFQV